MQQRSTWTEPPGHTDLLEAYHNVGWKLVCADPDTKAGVDEKWQLRDFSVEAIRAYLREGGGVGIQMGEVSGWLSVADADHEYAVATAPAFLPETLMQAKGDEISHYFYYCEGLGYQQFNDLEGKRLPHRRQGLQQRRRSLGRGRALTPPDEG